MARQKIILTYSDYLKLPDNGTRKEILGGELFVTPAPTPRHQRVVVNLSTAITTFVKANRLGEVLVSPIDVVLSPTDVTQPDLSFIATQHLAIIGEVAIQGAPDLIMEVLSPSTTGVDRGRKQTIYAGAGVPEYWIVDPEGRAVEVYGLEGETYRLAERVERGVWHPKLLSGLSIEIDKLWDR